MNLFAQYESKPKIRCCKWSVNRQELYIGHADGSVAFWSRRHNTAICNLTPYCKICH